MTSAKEFDLKAYGYDLPEDLIAQYPCQKRDAARLMVINRKDSSITHDVFSNLDQFLPSESSIVVNNSKVIPARLLGQKLRTGGQVEVFLLKDLGDGQTFEALLKPLKKIQVDEVMEFAPGIQAVLVDREQRIVQFNQKDVLKALEKVGHIPLPPYIKRSDEPLDRTEYQTVYAKQLGSVASPTAGLHFTRSLMTRLSLQGHRFKELTLHINYGTFKPVETEDIRKHPMHTETYEIAPDVFLDIKNAHARSKVVAVGTTSCRVLESAALTGQLAGETDIFIYPGYQFQMVDALVTNFHLPYSTLLMLVSALGGYDLIKRAYAQAIKERYRFYSYGDAMLII